MNRPNNHLTYQDTDPIWRSHSADEGWKYFLLFPSWQNRLMPGLHPSISHPSTSSDNDLRAMARPPSTARFIPVANTDVIGAYPSGTLFEADVFYALQLQPRTTDSAIASGSGIGSTNVTSPFATSSAATRRNDAPRSEVSIEAPRSQRIIKRRFKPTLNCSQCVERKTKCDRARPSCRAWYVAIPVSRSQP